MINNRPAKGFTIVELLIVVAIIGILAAVTVMAFNGLRDRANRSMLASNLTNVAKKMHTAKIESGGTFPSAVPAGVTLSAGVGMSLSVTGSTEQFCINGLLSGSAPLLMYYDSSNSSVNDGVCPGAVIAGSETGTMAANIIIAPETVTAWAINTSGGSLTLSSRAGVAGDPVPNKPVMVYNNTTARTVTWAYLRTSVDISKIKAGQSYTVTYWVRKTGTGYNGNVQTFGVMDGSTANKSLNYGTNVAAPSSWAKMSAVTSAVADAVSTNTLYASLSPSYFATTGWSLEMQGFELIQN